MILRYIGVKKYNDIDKDININLGGRFVFQHKENKLSIIEEQEYVDSSYMYRGRNVSEISGIVGKNGSGKTTILRIISKVVSGRGKDYILIEENEEKGLLVYSDMKVEISETAQILIRKGYTIKLCGKIAKAKIDSMYQIYFSNIFDKTKPLEESINLSDISTNYEIRNYIEHDYKSFNGLVNFEDGIGEDVIETFKYSEIDKKMELALVMKEDYLQDKKTMLFTFPEYINIYLSDNIFLKNKMTEIISRDLEEEEKKRFDIVCKNIDDSLSKTLKTKAEFEEQFIVHIMHDIILDFLRKEKCSLEMLVKALGIMEKKENWNIIENILGNSELIFGLVKKEKYNEKQAKKNNSLELAYNDIVKMLDWIEENEAYLERNNVYEMNDELYEIAELLYDRQSKKIQTCLERIEEEFEEILRDYGELEIEEIQEEIERLDNMLEDLRIALTEEMETKIQIRVDSQIELFSEIDELQNVEENILDVYESIKEKFSIIKKLKIILDKESTSVANGVDTYIKVRLKDSEMLEFYKEYKRMQYQTFKLVADHEDLSSGQNAYLDMCARLYQCAKLPGLNNANQVLLFLDEGEMYLHPQMQVKYIRNLMFMLKKIFPQKIIQIILTTNSPFLVSDIQGANILYLREINISEGIYYKNQNVLGKTFGTSVNALLFNNFFMEEGIIGFFAKEKIDNIIRLLNKNGSIPSIDQKNLKTLISVIGDPLVQKKLQLMYEEKVNNVDKIEKDIEYYKNIVRRLEEKKTVMKGMKTK